MNIPVVKVKISPLQATKVHGDVDTRVHIFAATALSGGRVASPTLGRLYLWYSFYRRLSELQDQSGHGVKKNLHLLRHPGSNTGRPARSQAPCHLSYLAHNEHSNF